MVQDAHDLSLVAFGLTFALLFVMRLWEPPQWLAIVFLLVILGTAAFAVAHLLFGLRLMLPVSEASATVIRDSAVLLGFLSALGVLALELRKYRRKSD